MRHNLFCLLLATVMVACSGGNNEATPAENLIIRLSEIQKRGYMFGHQDDPFYGTTWSWDMDQSDTKLVTGDLPGVMGFELGGIEMCDQKNLDSVSFSRMHDEIVKHYERGGVITVSWHPRNPLTGGTAWDVTNSNTVRSILPGGENCDKFQDWMGRVRDFLLSLRDENGEQVPLILRPWHEYNGSWFWWGEKLCTADEYKGLWNMFQDFINASEVDSDTTLRDYIVWSCSPNLQGGWTMEKFLERFPCDERVDLVGQDCYQWGTEKDFIDGNHADMTFLADYAKAHGKLLAVTECGYVNSPDPTWWTRVLKPILDSYPICYMLCWRNYSKEHFGPAPDLVTKDDFVKFYNSENTLFLSDIQ